MHILLIQILLIFQKQVENTFIHLSHDFSLLACFVELLWMCPWLLALLNSYGRTLAGSCRGTVQADKQVHQIILYCPGYIDIGRSKRSFSRFLAW
jgi:hypothetical protein